MNSDIDFESIYQDYLKMDDDEAFYAFCMGNPPGLLHYFACRDAGTSPKLAEMLALGTPCEVQGTNAQFFKGFDKDQFKSGESRMGAELDKRYRAYAESIGVSTHSKKYLHSAAEFPGDPRAFVSSTSDVLRLAREQNFSVDGAVQYKAVQYDPGDGPQSTVPADA